MKPLFAKAQGKACYTVFLNGWSLWCSTKTPQSPQCLIGGSVCSLHTSEVWLVWGLSWIEMIGVLEKNDGQTMAACRIFLVLQQLKAFRSATGNQFWQILTVCIEWYVVCMWLIFYRLRRYNKRFRLSIKLLANVLSWQASPAWDPQMKLLATRHSPKNGSHSCHSAVYIRILMYFMILCQRLISLTVVLHCKWVSNSPEFLDGLLQCKIMSLFLP